MDGALLERKGRDRRVLQNGFLPLEELFVEQNARFEPRRIIESIRSAGDVSTDVCAIANLSIGPLLVDVPMTNAEGFRYAPVSHDTLNHRVMASTPFWTCSSVDYSIHDGTARDGVRGMREDAPATKRGNLPLIDTISQ